MAADKTVACFDPIDERTLTFFAHRRRLIPTNPCQVARGVKNDRRVSAEILVENATVFGRLNFKSVFFSVSNKDSFREGQFITLTANDSVLIPG